MTGPLSGAVRGLFEWFDYGPNYRKYRGEPVADDTALVLFTGLRRITSLGSQSETRHAGLLSLTLTKKRCHHIPEELQSGTYVR